MQSEHEQYFDYLRRRSRIGLWYRNYWLYPRLCRHLFGRVLDIGCGIGDMLRFRPGTIGVDINPATISYCRENGLDARQMDVDLLPFEDAEFDGVVLDNVLEHITNPMPLLGEIRRVLRSNSTLVIGVPGLRGFSADPDHKIFYDDMVLRDTLRQAGFKWKNTIRLPLPIPLLGLLSKSYCIYGVFTPITYD